MKSKSKLAAEKDQYYTNPKVANYCFSVFLKKLKEEKVNLNKILFIEPSAGTGAFLTPIKTNNLNYWAGDIEPKETTIKKHNFLSDPLPNVFQEEHVFIGNPPFGKKGKLAVSFLNKALETSKYVAFIVPKQFSKWSIQSQINQDAGLIYNEELPDDAFIFNEKPYKLRTVFQIWKKPIEKKELNLRITKKPPTEHEDFFSWQHNATKQSEKYFDYNWDFAVLRQGYGNFNELYWKKDSPELSKKKQWIFIKAKNKKSLNILKNIDYEELSKKNTGTKGFGKADLVEIYEKIKSKC